jgi:hypothetical protein
MGGTGVGTLSPIWATGTTGVNAQARRSDILVRAKYGDNYGRSRCALPTGLLRCLASAQRITIARLSSIDQIDTTYILALLHFLTRPTDLPIRTYRPHS